MLLDFAKQIIKIMIEFKSNGSYYHGYFKLPNSIIFNRDLKPSNILKKGNKYLLCDF